MTVGLIWAQSPSGVIGRAGAIPWRLPEDLARFKELTMGHTVVMGRLTFREWDDPNGGGRRNRYEVDASSVGPDLCRYVAELPPTDHRHEDRIGVGPVTGVLVIAAPAAGQAEPRQPQAVGGDGLCRVLDEVALQVLLWLHAVSPFRVAVR